MRRRLGARADARDPAPTWPVSLSAVVRLGDRADDRAHDVAARGEPRARVVGDRTNGEDVALDGLLGVLGLDRRDELQEVFGVAHLESAALGDRPERPGRGAG